jgi:hypothetical protein
MRGAQRNHKLHKLHKRPHFMPKRTDVKKILIIGSGPIQIGARGGFQAARARTNIAPLDPPGLQAGPSALQQAGQALEVR